MGHPQPPTPIQTDNSTTASFTNKNIQMKKSKYWDMNLHWLHDHEAQQQFKIYWQASKDNGANYFTKTSHPTVHHRCIQARYICDAKNNLTHKLNLMISSPLSICDHVGLQGCVNALTHYSQLS